MSNPYPRPEISEDERKVLEKTARKMYYGGGNFKLRSLTTLLEENSKLLKEVNEHRIARGYDPLPGYVHQ